MPWPMRRCALTPKVGRRRFESSRHAGVLGLLSGPSARRARARRQVVRLAESERPIIPRCTSRKSVASGQPVSVSTTAPWPSRRLTGSCGSGSVRTPIRPAARLTALALRYRRIRGNPGCARATRATKLAAMQAATAASASATCAAATPSAPSRSTTMPNASVSSA